MPEHCPICDTELLGGEYCPTCKRRVVDEQLARQVAMLEGAIEGWRAGGKRLAALVHDAYIEGWSDRDRRSESCLGEASLDADWRDSEAAEAAKEKP